MVSTKAYPGIYDKYRHINSICNQYNFFDLVQAIFCINIDVNNRSAIESGLTLNLALVEYKKKGNKRINSYQDFLEFFSKVEPFLKPTDMEDYIGKDYGVAKLKYKQREYKYTIGTGYNLVYACMHFLPYLAKMVNKCDELEMMCKYSSDTISYFEKVNIDNKLQKVQFTCPCKTLFEKTKQYFYSRVLNYDVVSICDEIRNENADIEKRHFVEQDGSIYPIYNSSILIDLYDVWYGQLKEEEKVYLANIGIMGLINDICMLDQGNTPKVLYPIMLMKGKEPLNNCKYIFGVHTKYGYIIAINEDEICDISNMIENINQCQKNGKLSAVEIRSRIGNNQYVGYKIEEEEQLLFLIGV